MPLCRSLDGVSRYKECSQRNEPDKCDNLAGPHVKCNHKIWVAVLVPACWSEMFCVALFLAAVDPYPGMKDVLIKSLLLMWGLSLPLLLFASWILVRGSLGLPINTKLKQSYKAVAQLYTLPVIAVCISLLTNLRSAMRQLSQSPLLFLCQLIVLACTPALLWYGYSSLRRQACTN